MNVLLEALRELKENKNIPELSIDIKGKTWEELSDTDVEEVFDYLTELLQNKFFGKSIELQTAGGGSGPDEWYTESDMPITDIGYYDYELYISASISWDPEDCPEYYCGMHTGSTFGPKDLGLPENYTPEQLINRIKELTLKELNKIVYDELSYRMERDY